MKRQQEKQLEKLFLQAAHEPAYRHAFLEQLLECNIYCISYAPDLHDCPEGRELYLESGSHISLKVWDDDEYQNLIPFFTSLAKLRKIASQGDQYICLSCKAFFEMTMGARLVLNPDSEATKEFSPHEVEVILAGHLGQMIESYEIEKDTQISIGQPSHYPQFMVDQLNKFFETEPNIQDAYLAQIYHPEQEAESTLIIALTLQHHISEEDMQNLHSHIGQIAYDCLENKIAIDLIHLDVNESKEGLNAYFINEVEPFYQRAKKKGSHFFAKLFS